MVNKVKSFINKILDVFGGDFRSDYIHDQVLKEYGLVTPTTQEDEVINEFDNNNVEVIQYNNDEIPNQEVEYNDCEILSICEEFIHDSIKTCDEEELHKVDIPNIYAGKDAEQQESYPPQTVYDMSTKHLIEGIVGIINEFDNYRQHISNPDTIKVIELMQTRLLSAIEDSGGTLIGDEDYFDNNRHISHPLTIVEDGTPIKSTIRNGISLNNTILLKAIVKVE